MTAKTRITALPVLLISALALLSNGSAAAEVARPADSFVDSIGVNTHTFYTDTAYYKRFDLIKARLAELGVRHVREELMSDREDQYERLRELAGIGVKSTLILGEPGNEDLPELLSILKDELRGDVAAVEGANEFDSRGGAGWANELRGHQLGIYSAIKSDPALTGLPVVGPSIVHHSKQRELGDISGDLDYGNIHSYPDGYSPEVNLSKHLGEAAHNSGAKQLMATETGYHTALGWSGEHNPVSEAAMATYVPRMFLEYFRRGVARTFSYELLDEAAGSGEREDNFGLLHNDFSPKPAFVALRNTIEILRDSGGAFAPGSLDYDFGGDSGDLHHLLLQKSDGTFYIALWRAIDVWDPETQSALPDNPRPVQVQFSREVENAAVYAPNASAGPIGTLPSGGSLELPVGAQVTIVRFDAGKAVRQPGRIKLWVSRRSVPAGGRVAVKGRLPAAAATTAPRVKVQHWRGRKRGGWKTIGVGRASRRGVFRKALRISPARFGRVPRLRVIAQTAKPSRIVRLRVRGRRGRSGRKVGVGAARLVSPAPTGPTSG
ncbi:MAG TPA: hypothetical protein VFC52_01475 [Solirubrobacterales bacterium]|nr:hypothetical protein [Solirubrobacterales bacterium]